MKEATLKLTAKVPKIEWGAEFAEVVMTRFVATRRRISSTESATRLPTHDGTCLPSGLNYSAISGHALTNEELERR